MRVLAAVSIAVWLVVFTSVAQAQDVKRQQVQAVDYKVQVTVAVDSMGADLAALEASNAKILAAAESSASLYAQLSDDFKRIVSAADKLRRTSQEPTPATGYQNDLMRAIDDMQKQLSQLEAQFLALRNSMQMESRKYQTISNALKARHDIAMNSIRNMK